MQSDPEWAKARYIQQRQVLEMQRAKLKSMGKETPSFDTSIKRIDRILGSILTPAEKIRQELENDLTRAKIKELEFKASGKKAIGKAAGTKKRTNQELETTRSAIVAEARQSGLPIQYDEMTGQMAGELTPPQYENLRKIAASRGLVPYFQKIDVTTGGSDWVPWNEKTTQALMPIGLFPPKDAKDAKDTADPADQFKIDTGGFTPSETRQQTLAPAEPVQQPKKKTSMRAKMTEKARQRYDFDARVRSYMEHATNPKTGKKYTRSEAEAKVRSEGMTDGGPTPEQKAEYRQMVTKLRANGRGYTEAHKIAERQFGFRL